MGTSHAGEVQEKKKGKMRYKAKSGQGLVQDERDADGQKQELVCLKFLLHTGLYWELRMCSLGDLVRMDEEPERLRNLPKAASRFFGGAVIWAPKSLKLKTVLLPP